VAVTDHVEQLGDEFDLSVCFLGAQDVADVSVDVLLIPFGCDVDFVLDEHLADVGRWDVVAEDADELLFQIVENLLAGTVLH
jgi:hypothetical protein